MKRVWAVDDDEIILEAIDIVLTKAGYDVRISVNGECFQNLSRDLPNLILLDVLLSGEDGRDICKRLKSDEKTKHIPIIMLSAHSSAGKIKDLCGAEDFLSKPFDIDVLLQMVKHYTAKSH